MHDSFTNPYWSALKTEHAAIAIGDGKALRYPADVLPFGGMGLADAESMHALRELLAEGESIYVTGETLPDVPGLEKVAQFAGLQMRFEGSVQIPEEDPAVAIRVLGAADSPAMVGLKDIAFPGFFGPRTYMLGTYLGIELDGMLVAMAGERLSLPGAREISAVCTHPAYTGRGFAAALVRTLLRMHANAGLQSFLHAATANERAIGLYGRLGFVTTRPILFHHLRRV